TGWQPFMAGDVFWQLRSTQAVLYCGPLCASLDALSPEQGLSDACYANVSLVGAQFLGVGLRINGPEVVSDFYQRGGDLIVRYGQTQERPFGVLIYWRAALVDLCGLVCPRVDLVVSVETNLLDSRPMVTAQTRLGPAGNEAIFSAPGYLLARLATAAVTYAEMCHPDDAIAPITDSTGDKVSCRTPLFGQPLEKGVILRSRLRGLFLPTRDSQPQAQAALADFAAEPPPLTT
ncbi:MAG TPA: hypothetical protein VFI31_13415, partial [Pirellulales bacterium]|nr:hypothetical protein [Pirellulales bacterium]